MNAAEHLFIADNIQLSDSNGKANKAEITRLHLSNGLALTYGQINALVDFFGVPGKPISDSGTELAFHAAYDTLAQGNSGYDLAVMNLEILSEEVLAIQETLADNKPEHLAYTRLGDRLNWDWTIASCLPQYKEYVPSSALSFYGAVACAPFSTYYPLMVENWDHFAPQAREVYMLGHGIALKAALSASIQGTASKKFADLQKAYSINAFADHFLVDLFSSGHLRTPRKAMYTYLLRTSGNSPLAKPFAGQLAKYMHDEDCANGVRVSKVSEPKVCTAYGDGYYFEIQNSENADNTHKAVQASADEVFKVFKTGNDIPRIDYAALKYTPIIVESNQLYSPMFSENEAGQILVRTPLKEMNTGQVELLSNTGPVFRTLYGWKRTTTSPVDSTIESPCPSSMIPIPAFGFEIETRKDMHAEWKPGLVEFQEKLYCVYTRGGGSDESIYYTHFDGVKWEKPIAIHEGKSRTNRGPAVAVHNVSIGKKQLKLLFCVYKDNSGNDLWCTTFDGESWAEDYKIKNFASSAGPALAVFKDTLYCVFEDSAWFNYNLRYSTYDSQSDSWVDDRAFNDPPAYKTNGSLTNTAPALATYNYRGQEYLYCVYKDNSSSKLWCTIYDGNGWLPDAQFPVSETGQTPALVEYNGLLYCVFNDSASNRLRATVTNGEGWGLGWPRDYAFADRFSLSSPAVAIFNGMILCLFMSLYDQTGGLRLSVYMADRSLQDSFPIVRVNEEITGAPGTVLLDSADDGTLL